MSKKDKHIEKDVEEEVKDQQEEKTSEDNDNDLEIQLKEANDKFLRLYSEFDNFRKRTAKEKVDIINTAGENIIKELLPILDDFERAIENNKGFDKLEDLDPIKEGFALIHNKLLHNLKSKGLESIDAMGEKFDVDKHEALTQVPVPNEEDKGKIIDVMEKGYKLHDKVIRYPKVVVGS